MVREEWLRKAVEMLDAELFNGGLDLLNTNYQIACGFVKGKKMSEVFFPYDGPDVQIDDLFPNTIAISFQFKDPVDMLCNLAYSCIQCFYGIRKTSSKRFKTLAESFYFDAPYKKCNPSNYLRELMENVYAKMVERYGEFPGKPVVIKKKPKGEGKKKSTIKFFCPDCGYEMKTSYKMYEKHGKKLPTCVCGTKMAIDLSDEDPEGDIIVP